MPLIRYPGSKAKLYDGGLRNVFPTWVTCRLLTNQCEAYHEPFFGSGAIGFRVMRDLRPSCRIWINDKDSDLVALWLAVKDHKLKLMRRIWEFVPTADAFYEFKQRDGEQSDDVVDRGFRKLALHRMSMSGFGVMSGGPIGGRDQENAAYDVGCRWNGETMKHDINRLSGLLNSFANVRITCGDFEPLFTEATEKTFVYADPPYYVKGSQLYKHAMSDADHARLASAAKNCRASWVVSYDDCEHIRTLFEGVGVKELDVRYSNAVCVGFARPKNRELAFYSNGMT